MSVAPTNAVLTQPKSGGPIPLAGAGKEWTHNLWGCCEDAGVGALGYFFPCCMLACVLHSMNECTYCACWAAHASMVYSRSKIRTALGIKGSLCGDLCCTIWCMQCVGCQMYKELRSQNMLVDDCCFCGCNNEKEAYCG